MTGSVIDAARLPHMAVRQRSLDDLVAEQCEDPTAQKEWARVAVPVHARGPAPVIRRSLGLRFDGIATHGTPQLPETCDQGKGNLCPSIFFAIQPSYCIV